MDNRNIEVGTRIAELRKKRGYTREKLSELADISVQFFGRHRKRQKKYDC